MRLHVSIILLKFVKWAQQASSWSLFKRGRSTRPNLAIVRSKISFESSLLAHVVHTDAWTRDDGATSSTGSGCWLKLETRGRIALSVLLCWQSVTSSVEKSSPSQASRLHAHTSSSSQHSPRTLFVVFKTIPEHEHEMSCSRIYFFVIQIWLFLLFYNFFFLPTLPKRRSTVQAKPIV
jgi:hypothetical protein